MNQWKSVWFLLLVLFLPVAGYAIMHALVYVLPVSSDNTGVQLLFTVLIIALGLLIPYLILKIGVHRAHLADLREEEVEIKNIPKEDTHAVAHHPK